jgi:hypothetical protein
VTPLASKPQVTLAAHALLLESAAVGRGGIPTFLSSAFER